MPYLQGVLIAGRVAPGDVEMKGQVRERRKIMGTAPQDMARLRGEIIAMHNARWALMQNIVRDARERSNAVGVMEKHFRNARAQMARRSKKDRLAVLSHIRARVNSMRKIFHGDLACVRDENARKARLTRQECAKFFSGLKAEVREMRAGFMTLHSRMAKTTKFDRLAFVADQKNGVSAMRAGFRHEHAEMAKSAKNSRREFLSGVKAELSEMRAGFQNELDDCRRSTAEMVKKARADRSSFVGDLKHGVTNMRQEFASEITGNRQAWLGITAPKGRPQSW